MKKQEKGFRDETHRVRIIRLTISYQSERFSRADTFDGSKRARDDLRFKKRISLTMNEEVVLLFVYSVKKQEKGVGSETDGVRIKRISISIRPKDLA